ncbi:MAG: hypothetical protein EHM70_00725 [Chloroflexota bacterium]|nr:MAG: hypothetical protein EHM70_00725 [Chloroflexota bacterium]
MQTSLPKIETSEYPAALPAIASLFEALNESGVRYCHWKSNLRLDKSLQGQTDLDLLVDRSHQELFNRILEEHDIKLFCPAPGREYPDIENFLGFDLASGRLFHLHVHYRLVLGEQFVKNYHLPLETPFLSSTRLMLGVRVPIPELEIAVLSLRALLKYRDRDVIKDILSIRSPGLPAHILKEIHWLLGQTTMERIALTLGGLSGVIPAETVISFLKTIAANPRSGITLYRLRRQAREALGVFQRQSRPEAMLRYFRETWRRSTRRQVDPKRMRLPEGGLRVAFVGADGAGKSTLIKQVVRWLGWRVSVRTIYMGSSQPSWKTSILKSIARLARSVHAGFRRLLGENSLPVKAVEAIKLALESVRFLADGNDRRQRYLEGCRAASRGILVLYDRYPLNSVRVFNHPMDGPRIAANANGHSGSWVRKMAQVEAGIYRQIEPPDHVFVLHVSPGISQERKPEHRRDWIEAKSQALSQVGAGNVAHTEIDADQPLDQVLLQVKSALWRLL